MDNGTFLDRDILVCEQCCRPLGLVLPAPLVDHRSPTIGESSESTHLVTTIGQGLQEVIVIHFVGITLVQVIDEFPGAVCCQDKAGLGEVTGCCHGSPPRSIYRLVVIGCQLVETRVSRSRQRAHYAIAFSIGQQSNF